MADKMFCYQCEQTAGGTGCTKSGVCGKTPEAAALQDLLTYSLKGLALYAQEGRKVGVKDPEVNAFTCKALFSTLTNVQFDTSRLEKYIHKSVQLRESLRNKVKQAGGNGDLTHETATFTPAANTEGMIEQAKGKGFAPDPSANPDIQSLKHILTLGLRGVAAYADHAEILGQKDQAV